jgi:hypothetical protein
VEPTPGTHAQWGVRLILKKMQISGKYASLWTAGSLRTVLGLGRWELPHSTRAPIPLDLDCMEGEGIVG